MTPHFDRIRALVIMLEDIPGEVRRGRFTGGLDGTFLYTLWRSHRSPEHPCGTVACAAGYAAAHTVFRRHGLSEADGVPIYRGCRGESAMASFLEIDFGTACKWFLAAGRSLGKSQRDVTPQDVAGLIRAWLRERGEEIGTVAPR